jgi:hypothetical protein
MPHWRPGAPAAPWAQASLAIPTRMPVWRLTGGSLEGDLVGHRLGGAGAAHGGRAGHAGRTLLRHTHASDATSSQHFCCVWIESSENDWRIECESGGCKARRGINTCRRKRQAKWWSGAAAARPAAWQPLLLRRLCQLAAQRQPLSPGPAHGAPWGRGRGRRGARPRQQGARLPGRAAARRGGAGGPWPGRPRPHAASHFVRSRGLPCGRGHAAAVRIDAGLLPPSHHNRVERGRGELSFHTRAARSGCQAHSRLNHRQSSLVTRAPPVGPHHNWIRGALPRIGRQPPTPRGRGARLTAAARRRRCCWRRRRRPRAAQAPQTRLLRRLQRPSAGARAAARR